MDPGATSHLHANAGILKYVSYINSNFSSLVLVRDRSLMHVTKMRQTSLPLSHPYRTLILKNVLITPNIIKYLIYVHRFVRENSFFFVCH